MTKAKKNQSVATTHELCPVCCKKMNENLLIHKRLGDLSKIDGQATGFASHPCPDCQVLADQGLIIIEVDEAKTYDEKNPWRTGRTAVIKREAAARIFNIGLSRTPAIFLTMEATEKLGLFNEFQKDDSECSSDNTSSS